MWRALMVVGLLVFISPLYAEETNLKAIYGENYNGVDIEIKYAFQRKVGRPWKEATQKQKKEFLTKWHADLLIAQKKANEENKRIRNELRAKERNKRNLERANRRKLRDEVRRERDLQRQKEDEKEAFEDLVERRKDKLEDLRDD